MKKKKDCEMTFEMALSAEEAACAIDALRNYRDRLWGLNPSDDGPLRGVIGASVRLSEDIASSRRADGGSTARTGLGGLALLAEAASLLSDTLCGMKMSADSPLGKVDAAASRLLTRLVAEIRSAGKGAGQ